MAETNEAPQPPESPTSGEQPEQPEGITQPESSKDARNMAMLCHLLGLVGFFAPLVIWLIEKDKHKFVDEHGRAAMNYQTSIMIYFAAAWLFRYVTWLTRDAFIGNWVLSALFAAHVVFAIVGAVKASKGKPWRYPIAISFLK